MKMSLRIALLTWDFPPAPTGLGRAAWLIATSLVERGHDVCVFTQDRPADWAATAPAAEAALRQERLRIVGCQLAAGDRVSRLRAWPGIGHLAAPLAFARAVLEEHRRRPFDVIESTNWYSPAALLTGRTSAVTVVRNSTPAINALGDKRGWRDRIDLRIAHQLEQFTARRADWLVSNTAPHRRQIARDYALREQSSDADGRHTVIELALDGALLRRGRKTPNAAAAPPYQLLFIGRAETRKGFDTVLAAMNTLAREARAAGRHLNEELQLTLIGLAPGDLSRWSEHQGLLPEAIAAITDLGRVEDSTMWAALEAAHLVLAPSRYESYGLVYREAAAFGRPLVASALDPGARDYIRRSGAGCLIESQDGAVLADTIRELLADETARAEMGRRGRAHAASLTLASLGAATEQVYRAAHERKSTRRRTQLASQRVSRSR